MHTTQLRTRRRAGEAQWPVIANSESTHGRPSRVFMRPCRCQRGPHLSRVAHLLPPLAAAGLCRAALDLRERPVCASGKRARGPLRKMSLSPSRSRPFGRAGGPVVGRRHPGTSPLASAVHCRWPRRHCLPARLSPPFSPLPPPPTPAARGPRGVLIRAPLAPPSKPPVLSSGAALPLAPVTSQLALPHSFLCSVLVSPPPMKSSPAYVGPMIWHNYSPPHPQWCCLCGACTLPAPGQASVSQGGDFVP